MMRGNKIVVVEGAEVVIIIVALTNNKIFRVATRVRQRNEYLINRILCQVQVVVEKSTVNLRMVLLLRDGRGWKVIRIICYIIYKGGREEGRSWARGRC